MSDERATITDADLSLAREMARSVFWKRYTDYLLQRREYLHGQSPKTVEDIWKREGQLEQVNRELRGEGFMVQVVEAARAREAAEAAGAPLDQAPTPVWLEGIQSDVEN